MLAKQFQPLGARHHLKVSLQSQVHLRAVDHRAGGRVKLVYTGVTNLELRARAVFLRGDRHTDFCEKPNRLRFEVYARLYF